MTDKKYRLKVQKDGPYIIEGGIELIKEEIAVDDAGFSVGYREIKKYPSDESVSLCRCGKTKTSPFCDDSHKNINWDGTETASHESFEYRAQKYDGPELILCDYDELCAYARFCDVSDRVWGLVEKSNDPKSKKLCIQEADLCPAGRLVVLDKKTGKSLEKKYKPQISLIEDPAQGVSGPIWLKGSIPVESAEGFEYEVREKQTLCRCGESVNKPFCNGAHASVDYKATD